MSDSALARRYRPDLLDRTWDFFASVPNATAMIFVLAGASVAGSLIEQEGTYGSWLPPAEYYPLRYGPVLGPVLVKLGLTHAYTSWWFLTLLAMVGVSLVVCSLQRGVPLYRALHRPPVAPPMGFLLKQSHRISAPPTAGTDPLAQVAVLLRRSGYGITVKGDRLLAEKGRWSRWGPQILHGGLILILLGGLCRAVPGWYGEETIWIADGETVRVPGTDWFLKSERFTVEFYPESERPKLYMTEVVVIDQGVEVLHYAITMNQPLRYRGFHVFQSSYDTTVAGVDLRVQDKRHGSDPLDIGTIHVDLWQPASTYQVGEVRLTLANYLPDFHFDQQGRPATRSANPNNPALQFEIGGYERPIWFFPAFPDVEFDPGAPLRFGIADVAVRTETGLRVKHDYGLPLIWVGLGVVTLGTMLTFYLSHRRIWAAAVGERVLLAGQAHRDKAGFRREFERLSQLVPGSRVEQNGG